MRKPTAVLNSNELFFLLKLNGDSMQCTRCTESTIDLNHQIDRVICGGLDRDNCFLIYPHVLDFSHTYTWLCIYCTDKWPTGCCAGSSGLISLAVLTCIETRAGYIFFARILEAAWNAMDVSVSTPLPASHFTQGSGSCVCRGRVLL